MKITTGQRLQSYIKDPLVVFIAVLGILPLLSSHHFYLQMLTLVFLFAFFSEAWNIISGFGKQFSLGHVAFFGIGAYITGILYADYGISPWIGLALSGVFGILLALLIGFATFRLRAFFFTLSTIACAEALRVLFTYWRLGSTGLGTTIPAVNGLGNLTFSHEIYYTYLAYILLLTVVSVTYRITKSRIGYYLFATGGDEEAAKSLGVNTYRIKLIVFAISGFFTAIGGGFYCMYMRYIEPCMVFAVDFSVQFAVFAIVGGLGTIAGPILGSVILIPLSTFFRSWIGGLFTPIGFLIYGIILVLIILFLPGGLMKGISMMKDKIAQRISSRKE
ncbi:MAG: branched-chain amino acid ABC transporter permease [Desulfomonilia bacterium]